MKAPSFDGCIRSIRYQKRKLNVIQKSQIPFRGQLVLGTDLWDLTDILNSHQNSSKNKLVSEDAVTRVHGSCSPRVMGSYWISMPYCLLQEDSRDGVSSGSQSSSTELLERCMYCFKDFPVSKLIRHAQKCDGDMSGPRERFHGFLPSIHDVSE